MTIESNLAGVPITAGDEELDRIAAGSTAAETEDYPPTEPPATTNNNGVSLTLNTLLTDKGLVQLAKHQIQFDEINLTEVRTTLQQLGKTLSNAKGAERKDAADMKSFQMFLDAKPQF